MSLHCSMLSTHCIKATVPSIRYINICPKAIKITPIKVSVFKQIYIPYIISGTYVAKCRLAIIVKCTVYNYYTYG